MTDRQVCEFLEGRKEREQHFFSNKQDTNKISTKYLHQPYVKLFMDIAPENILQSTILRIWKEK